MRIEALCEVFEREAFPLRDLDFVPERSSVQAARSEVGKAVIDDEFLADCIALELVRLREGRMGRGLVPFFTMPRTGIRFALGYWPPGVSSGPHEHTAWTITAVCRNQLDVLTFDRPESYKTRTLVPKNRFHAEAGQVGYIYEPCIHDAKNISQDWSLSLHVISPWDGRPAGDFEDCLPLSQPPSDLDPSHPYATVISHRHRQTFVSALAHTLASMKTDAACNLLGECFAMATTPTRRWLTGLGINGSHEQRPLAPTTFQKTEPALTLHGRDEGDMIALHVETGRGLVEELAVGIKARAALEFILRENRFAVGTLPGNLTVDEQNVLAEALEEVGLFVRLNNDTVE
jgi:hypothetical protein